VKEHKQAKDTKVMKKKMAVDGEGDGDSDRDGEGY
jgi:hypothetical protein